MPTDCISYQDSGYFTSLITDYLNQKSSLLPLYNKFPTIENFKNQIEEKQQNFKESKRAVLVQELLAQNKSISLSELSLSNINSLEKTNTFTITTGHQLTLFTGPLYFLYKIATTINLCRELKSTYPNHDFVPIYWMATEDHDFAEINHFNLKNKKFQWNEETAGPVGKLSTDGLKDFFTTFSNEIETSDNGKYLLELFKKSYLEHNNLTDATRYLVNELFGNEGLVILDGDAASLKKEFKDIIEDELLNQSSFNNVNKTNQQLKDYPIQVNPREINLFYIDKNLRERIVFEDNLYKINNTKLSFSEAEILQLLASNPEKFSPNVILRPLYQEVILPNLCYVGGGGEIAYWLELKSNFDYHKVTFPILLIRNSVLLVSEKQEAKADKLNLNWQDLFLKQQTLLDAKTKILSTHTIDFTEQKLVLQKQFEKLNEIAYNTDKSFEGAVKAQEKKQMKGLDNLEKRLLKAEKRVHAETLERIIGLQNELFPNQSLQERKVNFSEFYLGYGSELIKKLLEELKPLEQEFKVIIL